MVTSELRAEVEIRPFRACTLHLAMIREQFGHCGRGYGTDTMFHRTYFKLSLESPSSSSSSSSLYKRITTTTVYKLQVINVPGNSIICFAYKNIINDNNRKVRNIHTSPLKLPTVLH